MRQVERGSSISVSIEVEYTIISSPILPQLVPTWSHLALGGDMSWPLYGNHLTQTDMQGDYK